jgi:high affinity choline transporter 7
MDQVHWGGVAAVAGMYAAFLVVGWLATRKVKEGTPADLIVAGRAMPLWIATLTMTATWVDGGYLLGTAEGVYAHGFAVALQPGVCFGISLILGGMFFAKRMRQLEFATLIDPFEMRFGKGWAAVLFIPAMLGEVFWSAELLVAIGSTFQAILRLDSSTAILLSAGVVTFYTMLGGMWSVAYTDVFQLGLIPLGLLVALPFALAQVGGLDAALSRYSAERPGALAVVPPAQPQPPTWTAPQVIRWWDVSIMLMLGGIPWNCYFQRVLSCQSPIKARWHSILAGVLTILLTVPPLLLGLAAVNNAWEPAESSRLARHPDMALPLLLRDMVPYAVGILGLAAIVGAVTSSFSSSVLSAGSMFSWNIFRRLLLPRASMGQMKLVIRGSIILLGAAATLMALQVQSVLQLWIFSSDLIFVLLFPQLVMALYDPRANRIGSVTAFVVSLILRLGGGEPIFDLPAFIPYGEAFPYKTVAALAGLVLLPLVSRLTAAWDAPRLLRKPADQLS